METLENIYQNKFNLYELLNSFSNSGNKFKNKSFFINMIIQVYSCSEAEAASLLKEVDGFFLKKLIIFVNLKMNLKHFVLLFYKKIVLFVITK